MNNIPERVYHKCEHCGVTQEVLTTSPDSPKVSADAEGNLTFENLQCTGWLRSERIACDHIYTGKVFRNAKDAGYSGFDALYAG